MLHCILALSGNFRERLDVYLPKSSRWERDPGFVAILGTVEAEPDTVAATR
jgi:hypothetical protein